MRNFDLSRYKIKRLTEETDIVPEETLIDSVSDHPTLEIPIGRKVFGIFLVFVFGIFFSLLAKAFQIQVVKGSYFALLAKKTNSSVLRLLPIRGLIFDAKNRPLVQNIPIFELVAIGPLLPKLESDRQALVFNLAAALEEKPDELLNFFKKNSESGVFFVKSGLTKEQVLKIKRLNPNGVYVVINSRRYYPDGPASAHLLGYTSKVNEEELSADKSYDINDRIGRLGLEAQYERYLRGEKRMFNSENPEEQDLLSEGNSLITTIDVDIQKMLYQAMIGVFSSGGVKHGAAIIQNPKDGSVLGIVSLPSFDNNIFENSTGSDNSIKISSIVGDHNKPLLNRAISGRYSPGSTIKPLLALAGLQEGVVTPSTLIYADGSISIQSEVDSSVYFIFRDWKVHGWTDIRKAISDSVDIFFYALGGGYHNIKGLGIDKIVEYLKLFRTDELTGIDLPGETKGFVPTKEWKEKIRNEGWYKGDTYNISIGQGDLLVTPIWLNSYIGAIANGGKIMKPFIVAEIQDKNKKTLEKTVPKAWKEIPLDVSALNVVREGMRRTVISGTATMLDSLPLPVAAKTGTAQVTGSGLNSLFTVYGPYDDPEIVMTILVEDIKQSQGLAIRVAKEFLDWYFGRRNTAVPTDKPSS